MSDFPLAMQLGSDETRRRLMARIPMSKDAQTKKPLRVVLPEGDFGVEPEPVADRVIKLFGLPIWRTELVETRTSATADEARTGEKPVSMVAHQAL